MAQGGAILLVMNDAPLPPPIGYHGSQSEAELAKAARSAYTTGETNAVTRIKAIDWTIGHIIEIAIARGYTKKLGTKAWIPAHVGCTDTHGYNCLNAWKNRATFDTELEWYRSEDCDWKPSKASGPLFQLQLSEAYAKQRQTTAEKQAESAAKKQKKIRATEQKKALVKAIESWRDRYERLKQEHLRWARDADREAVVLNAIEAEIRAEHAEVDHKSDAGVIEPEAERPATDLTDAMAEAFPTANLGLRSGDETVALPGPVRDLHERKPAKAKPHRLAPEVSQSSEFRQY